MPSSPWPFLDHPGPLAFAHRGGAGDWPENTMPAFEGAVALGYRYVETDAHVTADGICLAFHDDRLDRVTDRTGIIAELSYQEVRQARVDGREPIPLLEDLIGAFPDVRVNIDPKHDAAVDALAAVIERTGAIDRVCVGSFSDQRITRLRAALGPRLCTSLGPKAIARLRGGSFGLPAGRIDGGCAQVPHKYKGVAVTDRRFVERSHAAGLQVHVWTIDDPTEMHDLLDLGVDGIMTDRPAVLRDVLRSRGAWY
ncbi:glycerophosphodiester phosphodiesterase [Aquihabitans daechungensis]|uniref:glycerophosphodiester phosphodiesterase n=1 Tax=Aquihabitans daechungensis TaxID=1052257 RepID=UPI003BA04984